ncbi:MAG TPA: hypothetical protein VF950_01250 [Planctomycetota bacterium]
MRRWPHLLVALLYLLPQAGLAFHHEEEAPVACASCPAGPSIECAGDHCDDSGHHHHDSTHHHPGTCRTCSAADFIAVESESTELSVTSAAFAAVDVVPSSRAALQPGRPIRAPPAA